jgi:hypothetical protein
MTRAALPPVEALHGDQTIDLRPLFAPRSVAVVGASPRNNLAQTVRDNLLRMGSETACWFVNPRYDEAWGRGASPVSTRSQSGRTWCSPRSVRRT